MGNTTSTEKAFCSFKKLEIEFDDFILANCVLGRDQHVHIQELESAFAFFLRDKKLTSNGLETAHEHMIPLCAVHKFMCSPGYVCDRTKLDTRHVIGISVLHFQKA